MIPSQICGAFVVKSLTDEGKFSGYASTYGVDHHNDQIVPGAFRRTLNTWRTKGHWPMVLWHHRLDQPLGEWTHLEEDCRGLYGEGQLGLTLKRAQEVYGLMKRKVITGLSIGFYSVMARKSVSSPVRKIYQLDLVEISLVTLPANAHARVVDVKSRWSD